MLGACSFLQALIKNERFSLSRFNTAGFFWTLLSPPLFPGPGYLLRGVALKNCVTEIIPSPVLVAAARLSWLRDSVPHPPITLCPPSTCTRCSVMWPPPGHPPIRREQELTNWALASPADQPPLLLPLFLQGCRKPLQPLPGCATLPRYLKCGCLRASSLKLPFGRCLLLPQWAQQNPGGH